VFCAGARLRYKVRRANGIDGDPWWSCTVIHPATRRASLSATFFQTLRSLRADNFRGLWWSVPPLVVFLAAWGWWFCLGRVGLYEISESARVEVERAVSPVQCAAAGTVIANHLSVGRSVANGDVLLELDPSEQRIEWSERRARLNMLQESRAARTAEIEALRIARDEAQDAARLAIDEARAHLAEAESAARFAQTRAEHIAQLRSSDQASEMEVRLALSEAEQRTAAAEAARIAVEKRQRERDSALSQREADLRSLQRQLAELDVEESMLRAAIERLEYEMEQRTVRAPVSGVIGEAMPWPIGSVMERGTRIASIVPPGEVKVVASFLPSKAVGRIEAGQLGRIRFEGFPWGQYGTVPARVARVAGEVRDGVVQIELSLEANATTTIPIQHGLPCSVEVEVERVSPLSLVLRTAGGRPTPVGRETAALDTGGPGR